MHHNKALDKSMNILIIAATASIIYFANFEEIIKKMHKSERRTNFMGVPV